MSYCWCFGWGTSRKSELKETSDKKSRRNKSSSSANQGRPLSGSETLQQSDYSPRIFSYGELVTATNDFRAESLIGKGGFGTVYRGSIGGHDVAVKTLDKTGVQGDREFLVEVLMLALFRHENLVGLVGYCAEVGQRHIVYEYMPLGSLEDHIHNLRSDKDALDWNTRMKIAAGTAKGLEYLHNEAKPPVIYRDLKSSNILLDHGFKPKLSDFGLAKLGPSSDMSHVSTRVMENRGYSAPEYVTTGKLTLKSDIYSFGVMMLELITGRKALLEDSSDESDDSVCPSRFLVNWAHSLFMKGEIKQMVDPMLSVKGGYSELSLRRALEVAFICVKEEANARPTIHEVVIALDYLVECSSKKQKKKKKN